LRLRAKKGEKATILAVARKMLFIIWHLLVKGERYVEDTFEKAVKDIRGRCRGSIPLDEMIKIL
jgi:hypothetical protein